MPGGVGGRGTGPACVVFLRKIFFFEALWGGGGYKGSGRGGPKAKWRFLKDALWGGGRYKGSGRGPRALVPEGRW